MPSTDRQNIVADNSGIIIPEDEIKGLAEIKNTKETKEVENVELEIVIGILGIWGKEESFWSICNCS